MAKKTGRPPAIDMANKETRKEVETLGKLAATHEEMANVLGCTVRTIENYMSDQEGEFFRVYKSHYGEVNKSLRRAQIGLALKGNATMLIWLGKQRLGQMDRLPVEGKAQESLPDILREIADRLPD